MIEQITLTLNKPTAQILARFLTYHGYEFRSCYDDQAQIRAPYFSTVPSPESRAAWLEVVAALEGKDAPSIPITY